MQNNKLTLKPTKNHFEKADRNTMSHPSHAAANGDSPRHSSAVHEALQYVLDSICKDYKTDDDDDVSDGVAQHVVVVIAR